MINNMENKKFFLYARNPVMEGVLMPDSVLHRFNSDEFREVLNKFFEIDNEEIVIPSSFDLPKRQEVVTANTPFTNRKKFSDRMEGATSIEYFDPYVDAVWLYNFNDIYTLIANKQVAEIKILTSNAKLLKPLAVQGFINLVANFSQETGVSVAVKIASKSHPRFFIAGGKMWKVGHSLNDIDKFEGIDQQIEQHAEWQRFWDEEWNKGTSLV